MKVKQNVPLAAYTTLGVGGNAHYFIEVGSVKELQDAIVFAQENHASILVLGEGANVLIGDGGYDGLVVRLNMRDIFFEEQRNGIVRVVAGAGALWDDLILACIKRGLRGMENTSGIPGSVGAAVVGNIAAYGHAVSDTLDSVKVVDIESVGGEIETLRAKDIGLAYRYSDFQSERLGSKVIVTATFSLDRATPAKLEYASALKVADELGLNIENIEEHRKVILEARRRAGSLLEKENGKVSKTAGSFFRNPEVPTELAREILDYEEFGVSKQGILRQNKIHGGRTTRVSAAHVLLAAGFQRGQSWGSVRLHPKHILKIENTGGASAQDIYNVSSEIVTTVKNKFGIQLEPEVRFIGF